MDDNDFSADWIRDNLIPLLLDKDRLARMAASSEHLGIRNADRRMADLILEVAASGQDSRKQHSRKQHSRTQHGRKQ